MSESDPTTPDASASPADVTPPTAPAPPPPPPAAPSLAAPVAPEPAAQVAPDSTNPSTPAAPAATTKTPLGPLVAALAVGALVGGGTGAGVAAWAVAASVSQPAPASGEAQSITVNDPDSVNTVNAVAAKAAPSVVTIAASASAGAGTGSGVILSTDGYVLTNNHVVTLDGQTNDATLEVTTTDGRIFSAEIVGTDPVVDLAVLKLDGASGLTPIEFGNVDALDVGDRAVAIGAPLGLANTVTDGIVSALNRSIQVGSSAVPDDTPDDSEGEQNGRGPFNFDFGQGSSGGATGTIAIPVIQTDASINPGNSGGALVDDAGRLIGINVAIASAGGSSSTAGSIGVGFAIPADLAKRVADEIIESGAATHGLLGATVRDASSADGSVVGAVIDSVTDGGGAALAGLEPGDVITEFAGLPITGSVDLTAQVRAKAAGTEVEISLVRDGETQTVTATLGEYQP